MIDLNRPVCTRDGRHARILETGSDHTMGGYSYPLVAEVEHPNEPGGWVRWHYMADGRWKSNDVSNGNDLVNYRTHEEHVRWARGIDDARRAVVADAGITDKKTAMVLCAVFNQIWERMDEGCTKFRICDSSFEDILEGCGCGARRVKTWLRKGDPGFWVVTLKGATLFNLMDAATRKAWEARP